MIVAKAPLAGNPSHPGQFVRLKIIEPRGLSVKDAASALGVHRVALSRLLNEQAALSAEMAIRLEKAFGVDMADLMRMQSEYDIGQARLKFSSIEVSKNINDNGTKDANRRIKMHKKSRYAELGEIRKLKSNHR